ncbi:hypothetical protein [Nocardia sp. alder85J]|uniref:hypothetical protein n=1 Tax=Nocardia sp. alder85J TaxID=2862949 RepID=UPI001CD2331C|nr:hypothetical protein [Nocardia sp. alder85J]MCX4090835.1 hypothetical protein [Nocardia sp. alder85J]
MTALFALAVAASAVTAGTAAAAPSGTDNAAVVAAPAAAPVDEQQAPGAAQSGPVDPNTEYTKAFDAIAMAWGNDSTLGRVVGSAIGAAVGCGLGAVTAGSLTIAVPVITPIMAFGGCVVGGGTAGFLGGTVGSIVTGAGPLADAVGQQYGSLHAKGLIAQPLPDAAAAR